jgi:putative membrane protein insertion efficiency factor
MAVNGIGKRALIAMVGTYRKYISPLKKPCCRFYPTCSHYAAQALERHGAVKGGLMAVWRVLRCNPFGKGGYDPVK